VRILENGNGASSTYAAAVNSAKQRIAGGETQCHAN
jgi:hypothetical protein